MIPAGHDGEVCVRHHRDMQVDVGPLADAIESPDALLDEPGIERQIEQHEVMSKLEVASLAANLRADEEPRAVRIRKPRGAAVALNQRHVLVERGRRHVWSAGAAPSRWRRLSAASDRSAAPCQERRPGAVRPASRCVDRTRTTSGHRPRPRWTCRIPIRQPGPLRMPDAGIELVQVNDPGREAADGRTGVAKHHAASAVTIDQAFDECRTPSLVRQRILYGGGSVTERARQGRRIFD